MRDLLPAELDLALAALQPEEGEAEALTAAPREPYTRALMAAAFDLKAERGGAR